MIIVVDFNEEEGCKVVEWFNDFCVDFVKVDVMNYEDMVVKMKGYDIVMDGMTIKLNGLLICCIVEVGCYGVNLNGFGEENELYVIFV